MACVSFSVGAYYTMIAGWALFYFFNSMAATLPWSYCPTTRHNETIGKGESWETTYTGGVSVLSIKIVDIIFII